MVFFSCSWILWFLLMRFHRKCILCRIAKVFNVCGLWPSKSSAPRAVSTRTQFHIFSIQSAPNLRLFKETRTTISLLATVTYPAATITRLLLHRYIQHTHAVNEQAEARASDWLAPQIGSFIIMSYGLSGWMFLLMAKLQNINITHCDYGQSRI